MNTKNHELKAVESSSRQNIGFKPLDEPNKVGIQ